MIGDSWVQKEWETSSHKDLGLPLHEVRGIAAQRKNYLMSFQNAAFRRQAMKVNMPRNNSTQTPMRTRVF